VSTSANSSFEDHSLYCSNRRSGALSPRLDQFHQLVAANTLQVGITCVYRNVASPLGLLYDSSSLTGIARTRNHTVFHELDAVAPITHAHDIKIRPMV
jgi:hypothetical protein